MKIRFRSRLLVTIVLLAGLAGAAGMLAGGRRGDGGSGDGNGPAPRPALSVSAARPLAARLPLRLDANGNVAAWQEAVIGSASNGLRLREVRANVGDVVAKGQVLAVFETEVVEADLAQAGAALREAEANAAAASADAGRARALESSGAISAQQVSLALAAERTAAARVAAARAMLAQQQLRLKHARVVAPDSGIVSSRNATVGAVAGVGSELFRMIRQGRLEWRAEVTAAELARIKPGQKAEIKTAGGVPVAGTVRTVAPTVDPQSRVALVYVDLPPSLAPDAPLKAGMFASGSFALGASAALTVPQQALALRDGFSYVFRLDPQQRVRQVKVQTGRRLGERVEIVAGLPPDALVVTSGAGFLNDGDLVRVVADKSAAGAGGLRQRR